MRAVCSGPVPAACQIPNGDSERGTNLCCHQILMLTKRISHRVEVFLLIFVASEFYPLRYKLLDYAIVEVNSLLCSLTVRLV